MEKLAIVILNYLNYQDTIECVDSIRRMEYDIAGIVIVDNGSANESYEVLKKKYNGDSKIIVENTGKNLGFARGNNYGIKIARARLSAEFVYVVNNDVIFQQEDFFKILLGEYDDKIGMIGSKILLKNQKIQTKYYVYVTLKEVMRGYIERWLIKCDKTVWIYGLPRVDDRKMKQVLHGCGILFTPAFFRVYKGFYPKTFLYCEEEILFLICERYGLTQKYAENAWIYHKEDQSSEMSFQNSSIVKRKYAFKSYKYVVWWSLKNSLLKVIKNRSF